MTHIRTFLARILFLKEKDQLVLAVLLLAERTGFEPAIVLLPYTLSKRAPSTTRTPLRTVAILPETSLIYVSNLNPHSYFSQTQIDY